MIITPSAEFIRPSNTTQYAANDLVANSTTASAVKPLRFPLKGFSTPTGVVGFVRLFKDDATTTSAAFNLHLFAQRPIVTNGDNGAFAVSTSEHWIGTVACDMSSSAFATTATLKKRFQVLDTDNSSPALFAFDLSDEPDSEALYGLLEVTGTYTPASAERFRVTLEISDDRAT